MAKQATANPAPTFSPEALRALICEVLDEREQSARVSDTDDRVVKAFKRVGIEATPRVDVLTFNKWAEQGLRPKQDERSVRIGVLRLFHRSQCRPMTAEEEAARSARTSDRLPVVSPVAAPATKPSKASKAKTTVVPLNQMAG